MDKNGLVTVTPAIGSAAGRDAIQEVLTPTASPSPWSFSQLVSGIMGMLAQACVIVVTNSRKVFFSDSTEGKTFLQGAGATDCVVFTPEQDQTGRSLAWGAAPGGVDELTTEDLDAMTILADPLVTPVKQKKTAERLAEDLIALVDANNNPVFKTVVIDQTTKKVLAYPEDRGASIVAALPTTGNTAALEVDGDPEPDDPTVPKLPFEGGAV